MSGHLAIGPDGGNLLGFLASVGTLATLTRAWPDREVRMSWTFQAGWRPILHIAGGSSKAEIVEALYGELAKTERRPEFVELGDDLTVTPDRFRDFARRAAEAATADDRRWADFTAAYGCDATVDRRTIQDTALRTMSGAGHQHFIAFMRELARVTTAADLRKALFEAWVYDDGRPSMRWDPLDDRRYALRADNPSTSRDFPIRTVRGANRLAIEAMPSFLTAPHGGQLRTTGFSRTPRSTARRWTIRWPIWETPISVLTLRSLLCHQDIVSDPLSADRLRALGVVELFGSSRQTVGQLRSFAPAQALLGFRDL